MRRSFVVPLVVTVAASPLVNPLAGSPAAADGAFALPLTGFSDILVDEAHGHVFISGGHGTSAIVVTDLAGAVQTSVANASGGAQMLLSQDGTKVYVGLTQSDGVGVIDTTTLAMTEISTGASSCPYDVAETAGRIWYSYGCSAGAAGVGYIATSDNSVHPGVRTYFVDAPGLESSPALPGEVVMADGGHLTIMTVAEGTGGEVTLPTRASVQAGNIDFAITPDGSRIVTTEPYADPVYLTSDLSLDGSYKTTAFANAVAIRQDGMVAAGVDGSYDPDIWVYKAGSRTVFRRYELGRFHNLQQGGLAFGATRLYAVEVSDGPDGFVYTLRIITPRAPSAVTITPTASTYAYGASAKATVHLSSSDPNRQVSVYATPLGRAEKLIKTANVDASGNLAISVTVVRRTTFRVAYAGGAVGDPAAASKVIIVRAKVTPSMKNYVGRSSGWYVYKVTQKAMLVGTVAPNHAGDCLYVRAQFLISGRWGHSVETPCIHMAPASWGAGLLSGRGLVGIKVRMRAEWRGDTENASRDSAWRYVKFVR